MQNFGKALNVCIMEAETFLTIACASQGIYKEKGSKFIAYAYPVKDEDEVKEKVNGLRKKYFDARHHCYAYRLGADGGLYRANDDGEPAHSAGRPILGQLTALGVTNVLVVVVRYFGGILLGTSGLAAAYKQAAANALANAEILTNTVTENCQLTFEYQKMNKVLKIVKDMKLDYTMFKGDTNFTIDIKARKSLINQMQNRLLSV